MTHRSPTVTVIIPTHNRSAELRRTLDALCSQSFPCLEAEVVVVADGCTDGTVEMLRSYHAPFSLRVVEQPPSGPGAARNNGADSATGSLLIFLDDDVEPHLNLVAAHVQAHKRWPGRVVVGYYKPMIPEPHDFFRTELRYWWEMMFYRMRQPHHRYTYQDMLSGNFSIEAGVLTYVGGFDQALWSHEDYELGVRLIEAGIDLRFEPDAFGFHHDASTLDRSLERKYQEGKADILLAKRHPELAPVLPMGSLKADLGGMNHLLSASVFRWPAPGHLVASRLRGSLDLLEKMGLRSRWRRLLEQLQAYWYWKAVAEELPTRKEVSQFLWDCSARSKSNGLEIELDLSEGLEAAEQKLDELRPRGITIRYGQRLIGKIAPIPGAEPLRGALLRFMLRDELAASLLKALMQEGVIENDPGVGWAMPSLGRLGPYWLSP